MTRPSNNNNNNNNNNNTVVATTGPSKATTKSNGHRKPSKMDAETVQTKKGKASSSSSGSDTNQKDHRSVKPAKDGAKQRPRPRQEKRSTSAETTKSKPATKVVPATVTTTTTTTPRKQRRQTPTVTPPKAATPKTIVAPPSRHSSPVHANTAGPLPKRRTSPSPTVPASPPSRPTRDHAYAGPTFSNSPAASRLPMPDFLLGATAAPSGVPSLSPSSSTTSLHQYHSTPPSPTRASPSVDLTAYSGSLAFDASAHDAGHHDRAALTHTSEALRSRSLELLGLLRGSQALVEEASRSSAGPMGAPLPYASYPLPSAPSVATSTDPFLVDRSVPMPATRLYDALGVCDPLMTSKPTMMTPPPQPHWSLAPPMSYAAPVPHSYALESYPPTSMMPPPPPTMTPMLQHAATKSINDMYSDKLRALLRLDVQA